MCGTRGCTFGARSKESCAGRRTCKEPTHRHGGVMRTSRYAGAHPEFFFWGGGGADPETICNSRLILNIVLQNNAVRTT
jgi:hypothetical protein